MMINPFNYGALLAAVMEMRRLQRARGKASELASVLSTIDALIAEEADAAARRCTCTEEDDDESCPRHGDDAEECCCIEDGDELVFDERCPACGPWKEWADEMSRGCPASSLSVFNAARGLPQPAPSAWDIARDGKSSMPVLVAKAARACATIAGQFKNENALQKALHDALAAERYVFPKREHWLRDSSGAPVGRVDFVIPSMGRILSDDEGRYSEPDMSERLLAVEVKISECSSLTEQLTRYAADPRVAELLVVSPCSPNVPAIIGGKRVFWMQIALEGATHEPRLTVPDRRVQIPRMTIPWLPASANVNAEPMAGAGAL